MQEKILKINLFQLLSTEIQDDIIEKLLIRIKEQYAEQIEWLEENKYTYKIIVERKHKKINKNTNWPSFEHVIIYLNVPEKDQAIHYNLVWRGK